MERGNKELVTLDKKGYYKMSIIVLRNILFGFVDDSPNDMELGAKIRKYFYELDNRIKQSIEDESIKGS